VKRTGQIRVEHHLPRGSSQLGHCARGQIGAGCADEYVDVPITELDVCNDGSDGSRIGYIAGHDDRSFFTVLGSLFEGFDPAPQQYHGRSCSCKTYCCGSPDTAASTRNDDHVCHGYTASQCNVTARYSLR
jgi:hypothetical protein